MLPMASCSANTCTGTGRCIILYNVTVQLQGPIFVVSALAGLAPATIDKIRVQLLVVQYPLTALI